MQTTVSPANATPLQRFQSVERELNQRYVEREEIVRGLMCGLLTREHVLLVGPPGTAKSDMTRDLCKRISGQYFNWLLAKTSAPDELLGPVSLEALENDSYRRLPTGKMPEATVAFLDEIFKCNSATLNNLLSILNERFFYNDGRAEDVPLQFCVGASNELPDEGEDLGALWDRFLFRYNVGYIKEGQAFERMLFSSFDEDETFISEDDLAQAQNEVSKVELSNLSTPIMEIRHLLSNAGVVSSDRRYRKALKALQANAYLEGREEATDSDLSILEGILWQEPSQQKTVSQIIVKVANPIQNEVDELLGSLDEIYTDVKKYEGHNLTDRAMTECQEAVMKFKNSYDRFKKIGDKAEEQGKSREPVDRAIERVKSYNVEIMGWLLG